MSEEKNESKEKLRCDEEQYEMLKRCSEKEDMTEWNEWRKENRSEEIWLQGADLGDAHLENADLWHAHLENADLVGANLENAKLWGAHLENAKLRDAHLENANLIATHLENAKLRKAHLENADLMGAHLENAKLGYAHLENAKLGYANLQGAKLEEAELQGAIIRTAFVDGSTSILGCCVDRNTDFRDMSLDSLRSNSGTKYLLKYNIRRLNWEDWYKDHSLLKWLVKTFWAISDYGRSTGRVVETFFILALVFATIYYICGLISNQGIVSSLFEGKEGPVPDWLVPFRAIYFSIVTMTTLGFGDMHANCQSFLGHLLLTIQVILGYVLLGAMVTRLAVLFTADGPEGSFTPMDKETKEFLAKLKEDKKSR